MYRYNANTFKLHRLPTPQQGKVLGIIGTNGTGKSTALKILGGSIKPNLGEYESPPEWKDILKSLNSNRELQNYFKKLIEGNIKAIIKI